MKTAEIRKSYLDFFKSKGHSVIKSDSLIPQSDPTLLFTGAGMNQFKEYFLGIKTDLKRATSSQKCLRTGDLDEVGKTPYHHSFFEMLGNFSFGDYFKEEAIAWAWEYLTKTLKIPAERLFISVHRNDQEAFDIWSKKIGIKKELIARMGDHSNFWPADAPESGPNGPCGPCSEIYYEQNAEWFPNCDRSKFWIEDESRRYAEIWNLVFTQYDRQSDGSLIPLKNKNIDTGMGLERLACVIQGKKTNFETDIFEPILTALKNCFRGTLPAPITRLYAVADHARAAVVSISDGAYPSNEGRGYVIRKLIRRAVWQAKMAGMKDSFMAKIVPDIISSLRDAYPELDQSRQSVEKVIANEEERFIETLDKGLIVLSRKIEDAKTKKNKSLSGENVFLLYDTYGFPEELTRVIADEQGVAIEKGTFNRLLDEQRARAKESSKIADSIFVISDEDLESRSIPKTTFLGYEKLAAEAKVIYFKSTEETGAIILDQTPFYPEGGGQVGARGKIYSDKFEFDVRETQSKGQVIYHYGKMIKGIAKIGAACKAEVNLDLRNATKRNHTATHLLQSALRKVLGTHVRQVGSYVGFEKLRFDFTHGAALLPETVKQIEEEVNLSILQNREVEIETISYDQAIQKGALAFFGEKYGKDVRLVSVPEVSRELCGGTHCERTGDIGGFSIISETSISSGTRRIEAITGLNTIQYVNDLRDLLAKLSSILKVGIDDIPERIEKLQKRIKELEKGILQKSQDHVDLDALISHAQKCGNVAVISAMMEGKDLSVLRQIADKLRSKTKETILVLFGTTDETVSMVVALTKDLNNSQFDARKIAAQLTPLIDGSAGGRKDWTQGGGKSLSGIQKALEILPP